MTHRIAVHVHRAVSHVDPVHVKRLVSVRVPDIFAELDGAFEGMVVAFGPPTSSAPPCRVTARLHDGRELWCTATHATWDAAVEQGLRTMAKMLARDTSSRRARRLAVAGIGVAALVLILGALFVPHWIASVATPADCASAQM